MNFEAGFGSDSQLNNDTIYSDSELRKVIDEQLLTAYRMTGNLDGIGRIRSHINSDNNSLNNNDSNDNFNSNHQNESSSLEIIDNSEAPLLIRGIVIRSRSLGNNLPIYSGTPIYN